MNTARRLAAALMLGTALLAQANGQRGGVDKERLELRVHKLLGDEIGARHCAGASYLVLHRGEVVGEHAFGFADLASSRAMMPDAIVRIYSMSKIIAALAALQLFEAGHFQLDTEIGKFLPELAAPKVWKGGTADAPELEPAQKAITVRMLLNHTAGFTYDFYRDPTVSELYRRADLWHSGSLDEFVKKVATLPLVAQPGARWTYSISDDVLGALVERASGQPFADYVKEHLTAPLGMVDTDFDVPKHKRDRIAMLYTTKDGALQPTEAILGSDPEPGVGFASGGAGMFSTIGDYSRLLLAILGGGERNGVRILGRKTLELAALDSLDQVEGRPAPGTSWGLFCAVRTDVGRSGELGSEGMLYWSGAATTHFFVDPKENLVALLFCQHLPYDQHGMIPRFRTAVYQALR